MSLAVTLWEPLVTRTCLTYLLSPLISGIQRELALSEFQTSMVIAVPVILGSLLRLPLGILTDRYGGRRIFTGLLLLVVPALLILSQARSFPLLLLYEVSIWLSSRVAKEQKEREEKEEAEWS